MSIKQMKEDRREKHTTQIKENINIYIFIEEGEEGEEDKEAQKKILLETWLDSASFELFILQH